MNDLQRALENVPAHGSNEDERLLGAWLRQFVTTGRNSHRLPESINDACTTLRRLVTATWPTFRNPPSCPLPLDRLPAVHS